MKRLIITLALCLAATATNAAQTETGKRLIAQAEKYDGFASYAEVLSVQFPEVKFYFKDRMLVYREVAAQFRMRQTWRTEPFRRQRLRKTATPSETTIEQATQS